VQVAKIETEKLLIDLCTVELDKRRAKGEYKGKFLTQANYFGYEVTNFLTIFFYIII
jgi:pyrophosphate--fructose-6-phosphate 1-phosphotransferase